MRVIRSLLAFFAFLTVVAVLAGVFGIYLAVHGQSVPVLRALVQQVGRVVAGQHTEQTTLEVRIRPAAQSMEASAHLRVRADVAGRRRVFFLLNDGLRVSRVWDEAESGPGGGLPHFRLGPLVIIELRQALNVGQEVRIGMAYAGNPVTRHRWAGRSILAPDEVLLRVDDYWYPADFQSFFAADVSVTLPADLTVLHNGTEVERVRLGDEVRVRWTGERPIASLALVAGHYRESTRTEGDARYRVWLADGLALDPERILSDAVTSVAIFGERYGPSGFSHHTVCVSRGVDRAFNDGSGLVALAPGQFRHGDYGFGSIAHALAHDWWGGTVAPQWFHPGTGGEWIVEGFAEFSSLVAVQEHLGAIASVSRLDRAAFDPGQPGAVGAMSVLDRRLDSRARQTIYRKGAYVTRMLQHVLGGDEFFAAARLLLKEYRYRSATDRDVEAVFAKSSGQDLAPFFASWVRSDAALDLALDPQEGGAVVRNHGPAFAPKMIALWRFPPTGEPERGTVMLEAAVTLGQAERMVLDPMLATADMFRHNNVMPRQLRNPRAVARSARGDLMVVYGEPHPWMPATVELLNGRGQAVRTWPFDRGLQFDPAWTADGMRLLAVDTDRRGRTNLMALNVTDGSSPTIGHDGAATGTAEASFVARAGRLLRLHAGQVVPIVDRPHTRIHAPLASPDGRQIAYAVRSGSRMDLRVVGADGSDDRLLLAREASEVTWHWAPNSARLFAVLPGDWDWQVWELPVGGAAPRPLVREAAAVRALAVSPNGQQIAVLVVPALADGAEPWEIVVMTPESGAVQRWPLEGRRGHGLTWLDDSDLLVIVSEGRYPVVPGSRELRRLGVADGVLSAFP